VGSIEPMPPGHVVLEDFLKPMHGKRPINAELALRLARFFGTDARSWVNLQAHYDLERAETGLAARVKKEVKPYAAGARRL